MVQSPKVFRWGPERRRATAVLNVCVGRVEKKGCMWSQDRKGKLETM